MTNRLVCLYRSVLMEKDELLSAQKYFICLERRTNCQKGDLVVGRYSVLPWYNELYLDLKDSGAELLQTPHMHHWIADMDWAFDGCLDELTFPTWIGCEKTPKEAAPFVLKGKTNSKKQNWSELMYAETWDDAVRKESILMRDGLIGEQGVVIRKYTPLITYFNAIGGMPITKEFRIFIFNRKILSIGYYWHAFSEDLEFHGYEVPSIEEVPIDFVNGVIERIAVYGQNPLFYVMDVGEGQDGRWWVIELNDGQQSGLSACNPDELYANLAEGILKWKELKL